MNFTDLGSFSPFSKNQSFIKRLSEIQMPKCRSIRSLTVCDFFQHLGVLACWGCIILTNKNPRGSAWKIINIYLLRWAPEKGLMFFVSRIWKQNWHLIQRYLASCNVKVTTSHHWSWVGRCIYLYKNIFGYMNTIYIDTTIANIHLIIYMYLYVSHSWTCVSLCMVRYSAIRIAIRWFQLLEADSKWMTLLCA